MTVGIVTSVYGEEYLPFLTGWAQAIAELDSKPDAVTIAYSGEASEYQAGVNALLDVTWVADLRPYRIHPQVRVNAAIAATHTDWIIKMDVDDRLLPHALTGWQDADADVVNFGYTVGTADLPSRYISAEDILRRAGNSIGSGSPFRRYVWERNPFEDRAYDDWVFWIKAARAGFRFTATGRVDYIYTQHPGQITHRLDHSAAQREVVTL